MGCGGDVASKLRPEVRVGADQVDQSKSVWCTQRSECACLPPRRAPALGEVGSRGLRSFHLFLFSPPLLPGEQNHMTVTWAREVWKHVSPCCSCSEQSTWQQGTYGSPSKSPHRSKMDTEQRKWDLFFLRLKFQEGSLLGLAYLILPRLKVAG